VEAIETLHAAGLLEWKSTNGISVATLKHVSVTVDNDNDKEKATMFFTCRGNRRALDLAAVSPTSPLVEIAKAAQATKVTKTATAGK
jgi:hypothetical protein